MTFKLRLSSIKKKKMRSSSIKKKNEIVFPFLRLWRLSSIFQKIEVSLFHKIEVVFHFTKVEVVFQFGSYYTPIRLLGPHSLTKGGGGWVGELCKAQVKLGLTIMNLLSAKLKLVSLSLNLSSKLSPGWRLRKPLISWNFVLLSFLFCCVFTMSLSGMEQTWSTCCD